MPRFSLTSEPIVSSLSQPNAEAGGYVVFEGRVRNRNDGREVRSLEYEAFGDMALITGERLMEDALERFPIIEAICLHRIGHLQIADIAVRVEVAGAHRQAAFEACAWIIDELKRTVPIWKKEHYSDGESEWINSAGPSHS